MRAVSALTRLCGRAGSSERSLNAYVRCSYFVICEGSFVKAITNIGAKQKLSIIIIGAK